MNLAQLRYFRHFILVPPFSVQPSLNGISFLKTFSGINAQGKGKGDPTKVARSDVVGKSPQSTVGGSGVAPMGFLQS